MEASSKAFVARAAAGPARVLWIGSARQADMRLARSWVGELACVHEAASAAAAVTTPPEPFIDRSPAVVLLAADEPARWSLTDVLAIAVRWPLAPIVSVAATLVDGRRRSGPPLPGIEEVPWHDLPGRLACWLADRVAGRPGTLGVPATARREERFLLEGDPLVFAGGSRPLVSAAAGNATDLEGVVDLLRAAGCSVARRCKGRPPLDEPAAVLVWDVGRIEGGQIAWLRMLAANRPALRVVLLDSFPRPDTTLTAIRAGAAAVLGRPASAHALAGTVARLTRSTGLSSAAVSG